MFYAVLALLQKRGTVPSKHTGVIALFDKEYVMEGIFSRELSKDLHKGFELRQVSDYKIVESSSPEEAREIWIKALHFVQAVQAYLETPAGTPDSNVPE